MVQIMTSSCKTILKYYLIKLLKKQVDVVLLLKPNAHQVTDDCRSQAITLYRKSTPWAVSKKEMVHKGGQRYPRCVHCKYCGIPKGICQAEVTLYSGQIKPVALAVTCLEALVSIE